MAILDGWGVAPDAEGNAVTRAHAPNFKKFIENYPAMTLYASGNEVGLSFGEMGNSEVGHLNIGAGRVYYQTLPRINKEIKDKTFFANPALAQAVARVRQDKSQLHLIGLLGTGNVHASQEHLYALLELCAQNKLGERVLVHGILDGRDTVYNSGKLFVKELMEKMKELKTGRLASLSGRYYAMDRDNHWDRCEKAYRAMAEGKATRSGDDPLKIIDDSYSVKNYDEEFMPAVITKKSEAAKIEKNDAVVFFNYRPDRARELSEAFILPGFNKFKRIYLKDLLFITMTEYEKDLPAVVAYPPVVVRNCLAEIVSKNKLKQLHVAETEKYAHITFFLNGTINEPFAGEERVLVPSPKVPSYDAVPEMSAVEITKEVIKAIDGGKFDLIAVNFANADMVGHTGNFVATVKAVETVDRCLGDITDHALAHGGAVVITADHGNGEEVTNLQTGEIDKEHSNNPVPMLIISKELQGTAGPAGDPPEGDLSLMPPVGVLADVAPTVLKLMGLDCPSEMTGKALV